MPLTMRNKADRALQAIAQVLGQFLSAHPRARLDLYRHNPACIRVRIIDPAFKDMDRVSRDELVWEYLDALPDAVLAEVAFLLLLTPGEARKSLANEDFEASMPSRL